MYIAVSNYTIMTTVVNGVMINLETAARRYAEQRNHIKQWQQNNMDRVIKYNAIWRINHPEKYQEQVERRKARLRAKTAERREARIKEERVVVDNELLNAVKEINGNAERERIQHEKDVKIAAILNKGIIVDLANPPQPPPPPKKGKKKIKPEQLS